MDDALDRSAKLLAIDAILRCRDTGAELTETALNREIKSLAGPDASSSSQGEATVSPVIARAMYFAAVAAGIKEPIR